LDWLIDFDIKRSGVTVVCRNCKNRNFSDQEKLAANVDPSLDILDPYDSRQVWVPASRSISAPQILEADKGLQYLVWLNRQSTVNTQSCIVVADPRTVVTHTLPISAGC